MAIYGFGSAGIGGSSSSHSVQRGLNASQDAMSRNIERLSSGKAINRAADNAAGLAIANQLLSELSASSESTRNIDYGVSQADIADGALNAQGEIVSRMRELAMQSSNGTLDDAARGTIQTEFVMLQEELGRISQVTEFNGNKLLQGGTSEIQVGTSGDSNSRIELASPDTSLSALGLDSIDLSTAGGAQVALDAFDVASEEISTQRAGIGATRNRLTSAKQGMEVSMENIAAAASRIQDADIGAEMSELSLNRVREEITTKLHSRQGVSAGMLVDLVG